MTSTTVKRCFLAQLILAIGLVATPRPAWCGSATDAVEAASAALFGALRGAPANSEKLTERIDELLDDDAIGEAILSHDNWVELTRVQQAEFMALLKKTAHRAYRSALQNAAHYRLTFAAEQSDGELVVVKARATSSAKRQPQPIDVWFVVTQTPNRVLVKDIFIGQSSLISTWRTQCRRIFEREGFEGLVDRMRRKSAGREG